MSDETISASAGVGPGDKIADYRLIEQIGQGGMAVVYRARDERLNRQVALKLLAPALADDTAFRARFIRESRTAAAVEHQNIIPVYDAGEVNGLLFISMRYVQGGDVRSLLADGKAMPATRVTNIIGQIARALDAAHARGLVHRDVKPANLLIDPPGRAEYGDHAYLSDFGVSRQVVASHLTSTGQFVGTLDYIAPEQIEGQPIDGRADQYSLACAAYELFTGSPPFRREHSLAVIGAHLTAPPPAVTARRPELPGAVDQVIARAMAKAPSQRYPTCTDFADRLGQALTLPATVTSIRPQPRPTAPMPGEDGPRPPGRKPVRVIAVTTGALVAIAAAVLIFINLEPGPSAAAREVGAINTVLVSSSTSRSGLQVLVNNVNRCHDLGGDVAQLQKIVSQRTLELSKAEGLNVGAIAGGAGLKSKLVKALKVSLQTDVDYVVWAKLQQSSRCPSKAGSSSLDNALSGDAASSEAKHAFISSWNPVARQYGYPANPAF
jgi:serine/threonine-protein kinase